MLPGLTTLAVVVQPLLRLVQRGLALLLPVVLAFSLSACGTAQPSQKVLLSALALQIDLTQRSIADALTLEAAGPPQVSRVRVESQEAMTIGSSKGLHLRGRFDWRLAGDPIRVDSAFDLYLQRGERGQSWRLARPSGSGDGTSQDWLIDPLPLKGETV
ncbi:MAG: hypothetical protein FJ053_00250 [Cyanobacteria bacterium M_surface_10_m1_298]|jgi:hypothetical protein|nr:hypothetical protein [Cyanobacteria bacterium M_surface_10_m1_298]